jgi:hypothetical protein
MPGQARHDRKRTINGKQPCDEKQYGVLKKFIVQLLDAKIFYQAQDKPSYAW